MFFISTGTSKLWQSHIITIILLLLFLKFKISNQNEVALRLNFLKHKILLTNFKDSGIAAHFAIISQVNVRNFIDNVFHTIAEMSSVIFNLHCQFFANTKSFKLKLASAICFQIFIFSPNDSLSKTVENVFCFI